MIPGQGNYRCPALLNLAARAPRCFNPRCGKPNDGTVVACHSNRQRHGKGFGLKAHDLCAFLCFECHDLLDGRRAGWTDEEKDLVFLEGAWATTVWLLQERHLKVVTNPKG